MDFIISLSLLESKDVIYVVVGCLTKHAYSMPLETNFTTSRVVHLFFKHVYKLVDGIPLYIICNRDLEFSNHLWK
jgi:hypothetical protein